MTGVKTLKNWRDCAFTQPIGAGQLEHGGDNFLQFMRFGEIAKSVLKLRFYAISPDFNDFNPISPIFYFFKRFSTQSMF